MVVFKGLRGLFWVVFGGPGVLGRSWGLSLVVSNYLAPWVFGGVLEVSGPMSRVDFLRTGSIFGSVVVELRQGVVRRRRVLPEADVQVVSRCGHRIWFVLDRVWWFGCLLSAKGKKFQHPGF